MNIKDDEWNNGYNQESDKVFKRRHAHLPIAPVFILMFLFLKRNYQILSLHVLRQVISHLSLASPMEERTNPTSMSTYS